MAADNFCVLEEFSEVISNPNLKMDEFPNGSDPKQILLQHLPFIESMLMKVEKTEFEDKWQKLHKIITSNER